MVARDNVNTYRQASSDAQFVSIVAGVEAV